MGTGGERADGPLVVVEHQEAAPPLEPPHADRVPLVPRDDLRRRGPAALQGPATRHACESDPSRCQSTRVPCRCQSASDPSQ